ncbi:restriction endonuclease [Undibacterium sp. CY18W]|uniref:Restriction endonuclease n=1 Tax=Undibacterium hunanense TaxID=2762292 RepID=A0ABR6ZNX9_9BURK|nr:restriction endonuclease [Undibacterium hunanense]MBC3917602.1 restriction endonuclease [Undibacterium hunanense]
MTTLTTQALRDIVMHEILNSIEIHRRSRENNDDDYVKPSSELPTDEEIEDFLLSNPLIDFETAHHLTDPGLLGFHINTAKVTEAWLVKFKEQVSSWTKTNEWLAADLVYYNDFDVVAPPTPEKEIWIPDNTIALPPAFLSNSPNHLMLAAKLLREGKLLSDLSWREFEHLIGELLTSNGWDVTVMQGSKDGGIDVLTERNDPILGSVKAIWQAKKYVGHKKVQLSHLRELSAVVEHLRATKGVIVTTSSFTKGAIDWVQKDTYRLEAKDGKFVENWILSKLYGI